MWRMKIKYICDLYKVISNSDIQLLCSYLDENEAPTIYPVLPLPFCIFLVYSQGRELRTYHSDNV